MARNINGASDTKQNQNIYFLNDHVLQLDFNTEKYESFVTCWR